MISLRPAPYRSRVGKHTQEPIEPSSDPVAAPPTADGSSGESTTVEPAALTDAGSPGEMHAEAVGDSAAPGGETDEEKAAKQRRARRRRLMEWPIVIVAAVVVALVVRTFVFETFYIPSLSMANTLQVNDRVIVNKLSYKFHSIHRGDVVVFRKPPNLQLNDEDLIKRVIGLPGEQISGHDGSVYVDGRKLTEPYVNPACGGTSDFNPVTVPKDDIFVMGDNRCNSEDSRVFGPISQDLVVGHAFVRVWPLSRLGTL
jgi:signal peptidase I